MKIAHYFDILLLLKFINLILLYIFNVPINIFILFFYFLVLSYVISITFIWVPRFRKTKFHSVNLIAINWKAFVCMFFIHLSLLDDLGKTSNLIHSYYNIKYLNKSQYLSFIFFFFFSGIVLLISSTILSITNTCFIDIFHHCFFGKAKTMSFFCKRIPNEMQATITKFFISATNNLSDPKTNT